MMKILLKNGLSLWGKWVWNTYKIKKKFPTASVGYMAKCKGDSYLGDMSRIDNHALLEHTSVGDFSYIGTEVRLNFTSVGKFCSVGPGVCAGLGVHPTAKFVSSSNWFYSNDPLQQELPYFEEYKKTSIGHDVWIGAKAVIIDGVTIGDGAVIGAGAVVTRDIPPYAVAVGVPAKVIKYRFEPEEIDFLLNYRWWDKEKEWILRNRKEFCDLKLFMKNNLPASEKMV